MLQSQTEAGQTTTDVQRTQRSRAPVFVLGSPRSGTTLLYHMLLSAGGFAVYRAESLVFSHLAPAFGDLAVEANRRRLLKTWLNSKLFRVSGLDAAGIERKILAECRSAGDFLRITMGEMARKQGVDRWADCTPDHLLYLDEIKKEIPDALIIHIVRDGRDVALSLVRQGWIKPLPWHAKKPVLVAGLFWEWMVNQGRAQGARLGGDYIEVKFEDLNTNPGAVLSRIGEFIGQELDYEHIQKVGIGSVSRPNTSFAQDGSSFNPVGRWKSGYSDEDLGAIEKLIGGTLTELGYPLACPGRQSSPSAMRATYDVLYDLKLYLKKKTPLAQFLMPRDLSFLDVPAGRRE